MQNLRNIIVTGANKGIGYGIVQKLAADAKWNIIMAVRNLELGQQSRNQLLQKYPNAQLHVQKLDVSDSASIDSFIPVIKNKYNHIDVLVNNAGVAAKGDAFDSEVVQFTFKTNVYGTIELSEKILPLIVNQGKIVTLGSMMGRFTFGKIANNLKERFQNPNITRDQLFALLREFEESVANNNVVERGWSKSGYGTSKLGINVYHWILGRHPQVVSRGIQVYVCCPGYVATDMSSHKGHLTIQQGAQTPKWLIDLPFQINNDYQGRFFQVCKLSSTFGVPQ